MSRPTSPHGSDHLPHRGRPHHHTASSNPTEINSNMGAPPPASPLDGYQQQASLEMEARLRRIPSPPAAGSNSDGFSNRNGSVDIGGTTAGRECGIIPKSNSTGSVQQLVSGGGGGAHQGASNSISNFNSALMQREESISSASTWQDVGNDSVVQSPSTVAAETLAHKLHRLFSYTALPTCVIIGVFLFGLLIKAKMEAHTVGRAIAGYCAVMSIIMTGLLIYLHLSAYTDPVQQRRIVRILLMVPVYAIDSCLALWQFELAPVFGLVRDCYESYVLYNFFYLLMGYLGGEEAAINARGGSKMNHLFPLCCLPSFNLTPKTFRLWKYLLVQYMVLKPILAIVAILLMLKGYYDETSWSFHNAHVYFVILQNVIVTLAFTSLVYFFVEYKSLLARFNPMGKFAAVKAVVFLSFWQSVILGVLVSAGFIKGSKEGLWKREEVSTGVQDFLICLEMLGMCYVHHHVFSEQPYVPLSGHRPVQCWQIAHVTSVRDVLTETVDSVVEIAKPSKHSSTASLGNGGGNNKPQDQNETELCTKDAVLDKNV